ncbi:hypothetical protein RvY_13601 [Ramazzottius varieornatus]|uniref:Uncharacterized protein n=1 Tax=Ramazzottius varieornatus TaxID=947166 RepID=A0A1D1VQK8_RAMVA|nr:hypothetical protein RvY_13601 [Ramazzottius varieornatus]
MSYQPGESVRHEKEQCQDCKCGTGGKVRCQPSASCPRPAWIGELGGTDCIPLYSENNCCPSDYLCKCVTFNETMSRGPRNVARCTTCSCSKGGGVVACEPVTCKIPYKFSDKCRPIYRGDDCCPIDYECAYSGKGKLFENDPDKQRSDSFTTRPNTWDLSPQYAAQSAPRSNSYDVLPYGQNIFENSADVRGNKALRSGPLGRSDEVPTATAKPTSRFTLRTSTKYTIMRKTTQDEINTLDQTEAKIVQATGMNGTHAIMISVKDNGTVAEPKVVVIVQEQKGSTPARQPVSGDPLLKLFLKVGEKKKDVNPGGGVVIVPTTQKAAQDETRLTPSDILSYEVSLPASSQRPSLNPSLRSRLRSDQRPSKVLSGTAGVWRGTSTVSPSNLTDTTSSLTTTPGVPQSTTDGSTVGSSAEPSSVSVAEVAALVANETVEDSTSFHSDPEITAATSSSTEGSTVILSTGTSDLQTTGAGDVIIFADHPVTGTAETTATSRQASPGRPNARRLSGTGTSRLNFESPTFAMSSADAGYLADDLSYKLFSVNFFRSPLTPGSMPANAKARARSMEALKPGNTSQSDGTDGQGQSTQLPLPNLTVDSNTSLAMINDTEPEPLSAAASWLSNVTLSPDFQVVTFGSMPRNANRAKSAGQILPPAVPGLGGPMTGFLPFETEVEFKGFGMLPEIEIKPNFKGLAGAAGLAAMLGGGGGGGGAGGTGVLGGQLAGAPVNNQGNNGAALAGRRMAAAAAAQDAMEELAEGGTGDGALALAATLMNPHRPIPARLIESVSIGRITTPPTTVSIVYPNGTLQVAGASQTATEGRSGRIMVLESGNIAATLNDIKTSTNKNRANPSSQIAEFNSFFGSPNHYRFHGPMSDPWSSSVYSGGTGAAPAAAAGGATTTPAAVTKDPFPYETVADVIEEGVIEKCKIQ